MTPRPDGSELPERQAESSVAGHPFAGSFVLVLVRAAGGRGEHAAMIWAERGGADFRVLPVLGCRRGPVMGAFNGREQR